MDPELVEGIGSGVGPALLSWKLWGPVRSKGNKCPSCWDLLSQKEDESNWFLKGREQASPRERLSLVPSYVTSVPLQPCS